MSDLTVALITIFGTVASVTGVVLYVFNGTRNMIKGMNDLIKEMHKTQQDILELLKKGFGDLSRDISEIKGAVIK